MCNASEFSVIVPVYNREKLVIRCLDSILAQSYRPIHLIVVDNNSTDGSFAAVSKWGQAHSDDGFRISVLKEKRQGAAAARNKGLEAVSSKYLMFMDSDDAMRPDLAREAMWCLRNNPGAQLVFWKALVHDPYGGSFSLKYFTSNLLTNHILHSILSTWRYAVDRDFFDKAGAWDMELGGWDDWELGIRLLALQPEAVPLQKTLIDVYQQEDSITGMDFHSKRGQWEKAITRAEDDIRRSRLPEKQFYLNLLDYRRIILAAHYRHEKKREMAEELLYDTLGKFNGSRLQRLVLYACYRYTARGGRGAYLLANPFLRR